MLSSIEDANLEYDNNDVIVNRKYAIEEMIISLEDTLLQSYLQKKKIAFSKEIPEYSEEFLFINEFTYMSKDDIIINLERIKEYKENKK